MSLSPCDAWGHVAYVWLALGTWLIASEGKSPMGWTLRVLGSLLWAFLGYHMDSTSIFFWSLVFAVNDTRGLIRTYR